MKKNKLPSQKELKELFSYDKDTGILRWKKAIAKRTSIGDEAGYLNNLGYRRIKNNNKLYFAHRIIWKLYYGEEPNVIDHINHITDDNKISNLRSVTHTVNLCNQANPQKGNRSGILGVSWYKRSKKWQAQISINGTPKRLGYFNCPVMAGLAYQKAKRERDEITN